MSAAPRRVRVSAPGKINLSLRVGGRDERGYHALATVFQALSLREIITATESPSGALTLEVDSRVPGDVPTDASNLALRAAELLRREHGVSTGAHLHIEKHVPIAGGMGGGSADAAAALVALNELWGLGASREDLMRLGAQLGADVPFAILGGTALGLGTGADLQPVEDAGAGGTGEWYWVLAIPGGALSTPAVYARFDEQAAALPELPPVTPIADSEQLRALARGDREALARSLSNDLQAPALSLRPDLGPTLEMCRGAGALAAIVSGSGPTLALLARDGDHAAHLAGAVEASPRIEAAYAVTGPSAGAAVIG